MGNILSAMCLLLCNTRSCSPFHCYFLSCLFKQEQHVFLDDRSVRHKDTNSVTPASSECPKRATSMGIWHTSESSPWRHVPKFLVFMKMLILPVIRFVAVSKKLSLFITVNFLALQSWALSCTAFCLLLIAPWGWLWDDPPQNESYELFATVLSLQPREQTKGGGLSREEIIENSCTDIQTNCPPLFDVDLVLKKYPTMYSESMNTVLTQECIRYNGLLNIMKISLRESLKALKGLVVMSNDLEMLCISVFNNQVSSFFLTVLNSFSNWLPFFNTQSQSSLACNNALSDPKC